MLPRSLRLRSIALGPPTRCGRHPRSNSRSRASAASRCNTMRGRRPAAAAPTLRASSSASEVGADSARSAHVVVADDAVGTRAREYITRVARARLVVIGVAPGVTRLVHAEALDAAKAK